MLSALFCCGVWVDLPVIGFLAEVQAFCATGGCLRRGKRVVSVLDLNFRKQLMRGLVDELASAFPPRVRIFVTPWGSTGRQWMAVSVCSLLAIACVSGSFWCVELATGCACFACLRREGGRPLENGTRGKIKMGPEGKCGLMCRFLTWW